MIKNRAIAKPEHLKILKQGIEKWYKWCAKNPAVAIYLMSADLSGANLSGADLHEEKGLR